MKAPRRVVVLGAGAIGAGLGGLLFAAGAPVTFVARRLHGEALRRDGLDLRLPGGHRQLRVPTVPTLAAAQVTPDDLVLVAVMAQDTAAALDGLDPAVTVASFQNGLTGVREVARRGHPTLGAMVYVPAVRRSPGVVALHGDPVPGMVLVGRWPTGHHPWSIWLALKLSEAGVRADPVEDIERWILAKLVTNLGGIVAALWDQRPPWILDAVEAEARAVFAAAGLDVPSVRALVERVGPLDAAPVDGQPRIGGSTRHALRRGQRLETDHLNGEIVAWGQRLGVDTPVNAALVELAHEATREGLEPGSLAPDYLASLRPSASV
ncbi:MAG: hypothetical protein H6739_30815 [Alphaproteobacteria bacterium]|nr:hypothetical protein [Alphaproteobacteria bacterium]